MNDECKNATQVRDALFVEELMRGTPQKTAAINAGFPARSAGARAYERLQRPEVQERIAERLAHARMVTDEARGILAMQARGSMAHHVNENGEPWFNPEYAHEVESLVVDRRPIYRGHGEKRIQVGEKITHKIKLYSAQDASAIIVKTDMLARSLPHVDEDERARIQLEAGVAAMQAVYLKVTGEDLSHDEALALMQPVIDVEVDEDHLLTA